MTTAGPEEDRRGQNLLRVELGSKSDDEKKRRLLLCFLQSSAPHTFAVPHLLTVGPRREVVGAIHPERNGFVEQLRSERPLKGGGDASKAQSKRREVDASLPHSYVVRTINTSARALYLYGE